jgi:RNA polymerase sigma-70 factor (ECF subfamily)
MPDDDCAGLDALYQELGPGLVRYLRRLLQHSGGLAEDIAQDAFLILVRRWPDVRHHPNPKAWLYKVARHLAFDTLKERSREFLRDEPPDQQAAGGDDPADSYNTSVAVREAVGKLPPRQREAVWLFYFQDVAQNEIATSCRSGGAQWAPCSSRPAAVSPDLPPDQPAEQGTEGLERERYW